MSTAFITKTAENHAWSPHSASPATGPSPEKGTTLNYIETSTTAETFTKGKGVASCGS